MKLLHRVVCVFLVPISVSASSQASLEISGKELGGAEAEETIWKPTSYYDPLIDEFAFDIKKLRQSGSGAEERVAAKYGLSIVALRTGIALLRDVEEHVYEKRREGDFRSRALNWLSLSQRAPIAVAYAGGILGQLRDGGCSISDVTEIMRESRDRDADFWRVATSCGSSRAYAVAIRDALKSRPALIYVAKDWTNGDRSSELAAYDQMLRPAFVEQINSGERERVLAEIAHAKLVRLLRYGLFDQALAFGDSLDPAARRHVLKPEEGEHRTTVGGFVLNDSTTSDSLAEDYAAALAVAGRRADARVALDLIASHAKLQQTRRCLEAAKNDCDVGRNGISLEALVVDQLLDDPSGDPYVLVEAAARDFSSRGPSVADALCHLLDRPNELKDCDDARKSARDYRRPIGGDDAVLWTAIEKAGGQAFSADKARYAAELPSQAPEAIASLSRATVEPMPSAFTELPLPARLPARSGASPNANFPSLPPGFELVRSERSGNRVVVISLSTRLDPNGEVSGGGYWVHISTDGGKLWEPPLYTGLAEHFPYIVPAKSRLPLRAGDNLHLEVQESLLDTASISYPPVGLHIRRKRAGIYLNIPIADLRRDSDGDGLSDIAARHLLLDARTTEPTPFIVGRDADCTAMSPETEARLAIVKKLFKIDARALIEPPDKSNFFGGLRQVQSSAKPPIFVRGDPADWRCVSIDRPMIVYSDADRERLRRFSPDFQLITLPSIRWNRAHTRGFVQWNNGWAGGTYRIVRRENRWELQSISEWIS